MNEEEIRQTIRHEIAEQLRPVIEQLDKIEKLADPINESTGNLQDYVFSLGERLDCIDKFVKDIAYLSGEVEELDSYIDEIEEMVGVLEDRANDF